LIPFQNFQTRNNSPYAKAHNVGTCVASIDPYHTHLCCRQRLCPSAAAQGDVGGESESSSHAVQAAAGSQLLPTFWYPQAAMTDFNFQHLAFSIVSCCWVTGAKGKVEGALWDCWTPDTFQQDRPSPTISCHPHGLVEMQTYCWWVFTLAAFSFCMELAFAWVFPMPPLNRRAPSPTSASGTVLPHNPWCVIRLWHTGAAVRLSAWDTMGQPLLGPDSSAFLLPLHRRHHHQAARWKGQ